MSDPQADAGRRSTRGCQGAAKRGAIGEWRDADDGLEVLAQRRLSLVLGWDVSGVVEVIGTSMRAQVPMGVWEPCPRNWHHVIRRAD